jgi:NNP family nitrate/nitrite transporter-like MFS transporter
MANISFFFPKRMQGTALGWNAGIGNLGVGVVQAVVPLVIYGGALAIRGGEPQTYTSQSAVSEVWLQNAGFIWLPLILLAALAAAWGMNNIRNVSATLGQELVIFRRKHAWLLGWLYTGTFGSFIGFAAAFPILLAALFPEQGIAKWAFVGPLLGASARPFGGWLSDRLGGARVTLWNFTIMIAAVIGALMFLPSGPGDGQLPWFFAAFMLIFFTAGIGNGSVFRVVATVFLGLHKRRPESKDQTEQDAATTTGEIEASVALGFIAAIAALGLFFIPAMVGISIESTGTLRLALMFFVVFYATCLFITWWWYRREGAEARCD